MTVKFGPRGDSQILAVSSTSARATIGTLPTISPAIAIVSLNALIDVIYVKLGNAAVTVSTADGQRAVPGSPENPLIVPVSAGETHVALITEGPTGDCVITSGQYVNGKFTPVGASQAIAVTNTDQRFALPALGAVAPAIALVSMSGLMGPVWVKLGNVAVVGSVTTSMRIMPGSADDPAILRVTNAETHLSIFCEGSPGDIVLTPGNVVADTGLFLPLSGGTLSGNLVINNTGAGPNSTLTILGNSTNPNAGIEFGRVDGVASTPFFDFHSGATAVDYDARIIASGGTGVTGGGTLNVQAGAFQHGGNAIVAPAGATQGDVIYHNGTSWVRLAAGTSGQFLQTLGAGANPQWAGGGGIATIASGSFPAATTLSITSIAATFAYLVLQISGVSSNTATRQPFVRVSTNNGSSYDTTAANYEFTRFDITTPIAEVIGTVASLIETVAGAASNTWDITIEIFNYQGGPNMMWRARAKNSVSGIAYIFRGTYLGSTSAINALQVLWNGTGNFDAGTYALYGVS